MDDRTKKPFVCLKEEHTRFNHVALVNISTSASQLEHDRDEEVCIKMDELAHKDFSHHTAQAAYFNTERIGGFLNNDRTSGPLRNRSDFNQALSTLNRDTENLENDNSGLCHSGSISNGINHRFLPPVGGNGVISGGVHNNSKNVDK